jgi:hypothetical protein
VWGLQALKPRVVRLYAVVVCSKLTHDGLLFRLSGLRGVIRTCGAISLSDTRILLQFFAFVYSFEAKFFVFLRFLVVYSA